MNFVTPQGFRDILTEEALLRENVTVRVRELFAARGYLPIETPTLEVMEVMQAGGRVPGSPFKLFDAQGKLLAMRPDVTLQIARMCATRLGNVEGPLRFRYTQRVFREADNELSAASRELTQMGIECIGESGPQADAQIVALFAEALRVAGVEHFRIALATVATIQALLKKSGGSSAWQQAVLSAYHDSDFVELDRLTSPRAANSASSEELTAAVEGAAPAYADAIRQLACIRGGRDAVEAARKLVQPLGCDEGLDDLLTVLDLLAEAGMEKHALVDFGVMSSFDYYTGIIFEAYTSDLGTPLGSGGRYDNMVGAFGDPRPAAGFAFYLEQTIAAAQAQQAGAPGADGRPLRIAVPKGSLNADTIKCLSAAGLDTTGLENPGRQLIISNPGVDYIIVRPTDAPVFVDMGAADCGICGKDSLLEADADVVELVDLRFGGCRFIVAEPEGAAEATEEHYRRLGSIRVATKYPNITRAFYAKKGTQVEVVKLHGNIELAPLTGMAERIVDITATGTTLRENNLVIVDEVLSSTARFFANPCAYRCDARIIALAQSLQSQFLQEQSEE